MQLKFLDRFLLLNLLPKQGTFEDLIVTKDIKSKIEVTQEELKKLNVKSQENGNITWDSSKDEPKEIEFTDKEQEIITKELKALSEQKKLTENHLNLYQLFNK